MRVLMTVALAGLLTACSGGGGSRDTDEPLPRDEDAKALLLTVDDFPSGWSERPDSDDPSPLLDDCPEAYRSDPALVGHAATGNFSRGSGADISEEIGLFDDAGAAINAIQANSERADCIVDAINDGKADDDDVELSDASFSPLSFDDYGDETTAYRFQVRAKRKGESGFGSEATIYLDLVNVAVSRTVVQVTATDVLSPYDTGDLEGIVEKALAKAD